MSHEDESLLNPLSATPPILSPLSHQINTCSRSAHSKLNRLIISRLPLALPPHSTEPTLLTQGLLRIAPIYITFESLWASIIETNLLPIKLDGFPDPGACESAGPFRDAELPLMSSTTNTSQVEQQPKCSPRTHYLLKLLRMPGLLRSERLQDDIRLISGMSEQNVVKNFDDISRIGIVSEFIAHIKESIKANPHVIIAYAWVFYMALFSGGRFIKKAFLAAGPSFWMRPCSAFPSARLRHGSDLKVQFLSFDGDKDGEDIKIEFKRRVAEAETLLTDEEKKEIVRESQYIFKYMVEIVTALDSACRIT